jgi:localization factor PodJL
MSYAPPKPASTALPPPLAAANAAVTGPAPVVENASLATPASPVDQPAAAADTVVASATPSSSPAVSNPAASTPAPAALDSPVRVELPPEGIGPLDLRQAAADGDARAQFEIAAIYSEGRAVPQDFKQAAIWYERAAAQGFGPAQYRLGNLYENGKGVDKDLEQARLWYQRAAEAGNRMAMHNLAALYAGGQFGKQDFSSAAEWFERASNLGMKDSQFNLGMLFARGLGVPQNMEESYKWFALAATSGDPDATKARDNVARSLDADAMKRAQAAVAAFKLEPVNLAANFAPLGTWDKKFNPGPVVTDRGVITKVQIALSRLGFDTGPADGHAGPKTIEAIKAFERGTGMSEVGQVNPRLLAVLGSQPV